MKRIAKKMKWSPLLVVLLLLLCLVGVAAADNYIGGQLLTTRQSGTVSGGLYMDDVMTSYEKDITKTFAPIPDISDIQWARLYVTIYSAHMQEARVVDVKTYFDRNNDGTWDDTWTEYASTTFNYIGEGSGNDNTALGGGANDPYLIVNDHMTRVTSDYLIWYDVTDKIASATPKVRVDGSASYDGSIKMITLIVAYNDGDSDEVRYWVNQGHDVDSYYSDDNLGEDYLGSTTFSLAGVSANVESATLRVNHLASSDGTYTWNGASILTNPPVQWQAQYSGGNTWDVTVNTGSGNTLTYDRTGSWYKIPLATLEVRMEGEPPVDPPIADFEADTTSGTVPLTVQFTDLSRNIPISWAWSIEGTENTDYQYVDSTSSTSQNAKVQFLKTGTYDVSLTATNAGGSGTETKTGYIAVTAPAQNIDFAIAGNVNTVPNTAVFAREPNAIRIFNVKNQGTHTATDIVVRVFASDVDSGTTAIAETTIASLAGGAQTTLNLVDPTLRNLAGGDITYTAVVDPDNLIYETDETNNEKSSTPRPLVYNGYKGKRFWEGASDITTKKTYDLNGDIAYSTQPASAYKGVGWTGRTETWTSAGLSIPTGATVEKAWLFISYNWDTTPSGLPDWTTTFNGNALTITPGSPYTDKPNFGDYAEYKYGLYVVDVTNLYVKNGDNILVMTPNSGNSQAIFPSTLAVIYSDPSETRKQIFINEESDNLAVSESSYATNMTEATAYAPFTGMAIDTTQVQTATLHSFAANAGPNEGNLLWNGAILASNAWQGTASTASALVFDVTTHLTGTGDEAGIQGTQSGGMTAIQQILVIEYTATAPTAAFSAEPLSGDAPLEVIFIDESTGDITSWSWDFGDGGTSTEQNPGHQYTTMGTYTVTLTVTGPGGSDEETKTDHITVTPAAVVPVAAFSSGVQTGTAPLTVQFTDESIGDISGWSWDFGDGGTSAEQNPSHQYTTVGTYTVTLTVTGPGGSDEETKTDYIQVGDVIIEVIVSPTSIAFGAMQAGIDSTGSTGVTVTTTGGTAWAVTASASNGGYMGTDSATLASPFLLSNDGTNYQAMTSNFENFMSGSGAGTWDQDADVKQAIAAADGPGDYSITLTFTGGFV